MKYEFRDTVRFSEVDESGYLTLTALVNYFQDTAIFQSEKGGIGFDYLKPKNQAWLLASWQIEIDHMPVLCDEITVATWTYEFKAFYGYRNFVLYDAQGNKAAWANSVWFLCDTKYQMPVKIDERSLEAQREKHRRPSEQKEKHRRPSEQKEKHRRPSEQKEKHRRPSEQREKHRRPSAQKERYRKPLR